MNRVLGLVSALGFALVLTGWSCTGKSSDAKEQSGSDKPSSTAVASTAADAYASLQREVRDLQQTATTQEKMMEVMEQTASKLKEFIGTYSNSEEAKDAGLQVALIYSSIGEFDEAVPYLEKYLSGADENDERTGYAHFYLAESCKAVDRYDDAQKHYKIFVEKYSHLNPKFIAAATAALDDLPALKQLGVGMEPIPFSVKDVDGNPLSIEKYKGKVVLLDFWATWCMPCKVEMPNVIRIHKKFRERGFEIIGISLDSDRAAFDSYVKKNGMIWPQYFDGKGWQNDLAGKYKVRSIPATFLVDRKGKIRYRSLRGPQLETAVEKLLIES